MNAQQFLDQNKLVSCKELAQLLEVSSGTVTKMKKEVSKLQSLALDALHNEQRESNLITMDVRTWFDKTYGNSYFTAYVEFHGERYFIPFTYGYGSHCETVALDLLSEKGLLPKTTRYYELARDYNINFRTYSDEVSRKKDLHDGSLVEGK